jgi:predicted HTH domain antitoxin
MPMAAVRGRLEITMGSKTVKVSEEAAVLALWEAGKLSTRRAAEELGIGYREFLDLLAARGIPVESGPLNLQAIEEAERKLANGQP